MIELCEGFTWPQANSLTSQLSVLVSSSTEEYLTSRVVTKIKWMYKKMLRTDVEHRKHYVKC